MEMSQSAKQRLLKLLPEDSLGFRYEGHIGSCRGSTPILKPSSKTEPGEITLKVNDITFFVPEEHVKRFNQATLDYDSSFFGKGLTMKWHIDGCACSH